MKRILVLTAGYGEGHNSAARYLVAGLEHRGGEEVTVKYLDCFKDALGPAHEFARWLYLTAINDVPYIWNIIYDFLDHSRILEKNIWSFRRLNKHLKKLIEEEKPDAICITYPVYIFLFHYLYPNGLPFKLITVVTDSISINSLWYRNPSDAWIVPNEVTRQVLLDKGTPEDKVHALGFPTPLPFELETDKYTLTDPVAEGEPFKVLFLINSGVHVAPDVVRELLKIPNLQLTVAVGLNQDLHHKISAIIKPHGDRVTLLGWIKNMPELMMTHHLLISKAGGATVQETIAAKLPMVVSKIVPGQEEGNWELLKAADCGAHADEPCEVGRLVRETMEDNAKQWREWKKNIIEISQPDSALKGADFVFDLIDS